MTNEITAALAALNQTAPIPLQVSLVSEQNWTQFGAEIVVALMASVFVLIYLAGVIRPHLGQLACQVKLRQIKNIQGRHVLFVKHTQTDFFSQSMIDTTTMYALEKALKKFHGEPFDLILHTPGGLVFAAQQISRIIRQYPGTVRAYIPVYAMSGGTLLSLACDEIHMSETACLGPVDPQLGSLFSMGSANSYAEVVRRKGRRASDNSIQMAYLGKQYTKTIQTMLADILRPKILDDERLQAAVMFLTSGAVEHGYPISRQELDGLGIATGPIDPRARDLMVRIITAEVIEGVHYV